MISISIQYKLYGDENWHTLTLAPQDYFDLEPFEAPEVDSVPRHNHAIDYLGVDPTQIISTRLLVLDQKRNDRKSVVEQFWNQGLNRLIEVDEFCGEASNSETILDIQTPFPPRAQQILRFSGKGGNLNLLYHVVVKEDSTGDEIETSIFPPK